MWLPCCKRSKLSHKTQNFKLLKLVVSFFVLFTGQACLRPNSTVKAIASTHAFACALLFKPSYLPNYKLANPDKKQKTARPKRSCFFLCLPNKNTTSELFEILFSRCALTWRAQSSSATKAMIVCNNSCSQQFVSRLNSKNIFRLPTNNKNYTTQRAFGVFELSKKKKNRSTSSFFGLTPSCNCWLKSQSKRSPLKFTFTWFVHMTPATAEGLNVLTNKAKYSSKFPCRCKKSANRLIGMFVIVNNEVNSIQSSLSAPPPKKISTLGLVVVVLSKCNKTHSSNLVFRLKVRLVEEAKTDQPDCKPNQEEAACHVRIQQRWGPTIRECCDQKLLILVACSHSLQSSKASSPQLAPCLLQETWQDLLVQALWELSSCTFFVFLVWDCCGCWCPKKKKKKKKNERKDTMFKRECCFELTCQ